MGDEGRSDAVLEEPPARGEARVAAGQRRDDAQDREPGGAEGSFGRVSGCAVERKKESAELRTRDEAQLQKLRQLGMTAVEEAKLMAMRDYILKLANAIGRYARRTCGVIHVKTHTCC